MMRQTTFAKPSEFKPEWYLADATNMVVGRMASEIATILMGKNKAIYTPYIDTGDYVIITNCEKMILTGNKMRDNVFRYHTGWIGGLKEVKMAEMLEEHPDRILRNAVRRMLPKTKLGRKMLSKLKIYEGKEHPHAAQNPKSLKINAGRK